MPQASDEMRARWKGPDPEYAMHFLEERGFVLTPEWEWLRKDAPTADEWDAIDFMLWEWDFGGWCKPPSLRWRLTAPVRALRRWFYDGLRWLDTKVNPEKYEF